MALIVPFGSNRKQSPWPGRAAPDANDPELT